MKIIDKIVEKVKSDPEFEFELTSLMIAALFAGFFALLAVTGPTAGGMII